MKDFLKWLGVNEKVAKIVVWIFIAIIMLILTNTLLESVGLPYYKITVDNLNKIASSPKIISYILSGIVNILNFYSIVLIVFRVKNIKKMIIPAILCPILTGIVNILTNYIVSQIFIFIYTIGFFRKAVEISFIWNIIYGNKCNDSIYLLFIQSKIY